MARKAKRDYCKGVYRLLFEYKDTTKFDLVLTHSVDGDPNGKGLNADFVLAEKIDWKQLKEEIKKNKITRAIWFANYKDGYVMPKDVISGKHAGVIIVADDIW